jgi:hypothetical protein
MPGLEENVYLTHAIIYLNRSFVKIYLTSSRRCHRLRLCVRNIFPRPLYYRPDLAIRQPLNHESRGYGCFHPIPIYFQYDTVR